MFSVLLLVVVAERLARATHIPSLNFDAVAIKNYCT